MIYMYNKFRGGVDKRNSFVSQWRCRARNQKWWRAIFERVFETAIVNAAIIMRTIYPEKAGRKGWMKDFRKALMQQLINRYRSYLTQELPEIERSRRKQYKTHTFIEGERTIKCAECGKETKIMCQECTINEDRAIGTCRLNDEACYRYHICFGNGWNIVKA